MCNKNIYVAGKKNKILPAPNGSLDFGLSRIMSFSSHLQSYMDSEIMAIMSQYMPLDNQHSINVIVRNAEAEPLQHGSSV